MGLCQWRLIVIFKYIGTIAKKDTIRCCIACGKKMIDFVLVAFANSFGLCHFVFCGSSTLKWNQKQTIHNNDFCSSNYGSFLSRRKAFSTDFRLIDLCVHTCRVIIIRKTVKKTGVLVVTVLARLQELLLPFVIYILIYVDLCSFEQDYYRYSRTIRHDDRQGLEFFRFWNASFQVCNTIASSGLST